MESTLLDDNHLFLISIFGFKIDSLSLTFLKSNVNIDNDAFMWYFWVVLRIICCGYFLLDYRNRQSLGKSFLISTYAGILSSN